MMKLIFPHQVVDYAEMLLDLTKISFLILENYPFEK